MVVKEVDFIDIKDASICLEREIKSQRHHRLVLTSFYTTFASKPGSKAFVPSATKVHSITVANTITASQIQQIQMKVLSRSN